MASRIGACIRIDLDIVVSYIHRYLGYVVTYICEYLLSTPHSLTPGYGRTVVSAASKSFDKKEYPE